MLQNVDKYPSSSAWTVTVETALSRLANIGDVKISDDDRETVKACKNLRNLIQHYELDIPEEQAKVVLGKVLSFAFTFAKDELNVNLEKEFKSDDTWMSLITQFNEFSNEHGPRLSKMLMEAGVPVLWCPMCGHETLDSVFEYCTFCDLLYTVEDVTGEDSG